MSTVGTLTKIATGVLGKTAHAVTHPVATVSTAAGQVHKVATSFTGGGGGGGREVAEETPVEEPSSPVVLTPDPEAAAEAAVAAELARDLDPAPTPADATEPKAGSREAAHSGRGDEPTDDWHDELDDGLEMKTSAGTTGVPPEINPATGLPHQAGE